MNDFDNLKLQKILEMTESNNKILRSIKRAMWVGRVMHTIYWIILIGVSVGAFWYLKPYFDQLINLYNGIKGGASTMGSTSTQGITDLIKNLGR